jgi:nucleoside-diphosphate-sugar epimerase
MSSRRDAREKRIFSISLECGGDGTVKISTVALREKRAAKTSRIFLTGGTGFLGSHVAVGLLRAGYQVLLMARSSKRQTAEERVGQLLDWFGVAPGLRNNLHVIEGSIERPGLGIAPKILASLLEETDEIIHCASNTSFSERKRREVEAVNIGGLLNVLDFASKSRCFFFHHLSTAYVAGKKDGLCREELADTDLFNNVYEETKARGERIAWDRCRAEGIRLSIYRPSIVYGDSRTGRSLRFNAVYYPVKTAVFLRDLYDADIRERGGIKAEMMGVRRESDGGLYMPIRMEVKEAGGINLVPVDYFVEVFMALLEEGLEGGIFQVVNPGLKKIEDIIDYAKRLFRIRGIEPCGAEDFNGRPMNALEILFDTYLEAYGPYIRDRRTFEMNNTRRILAKRQIVCPEFDFEVFARSMNYALEMDWGSKLFKK